MKLTKELFGSEIDKLTALYRSAFPSEERRPDSGMFPADSAFNFYGIESADKVVGFITVWKFTNFNYVEHFAIFPEERNGGVGSKVLELLSEPIVLEVEPATHGDMARHRIEFYKRNGFRMLDFDYLQPPYSPGLPSVPLRLMVKGNTDVSGAEISETLRHRVYNAG